MLENKKILIAGGAGYLASGIIDRLKDIKCHITRLDRENAGFMPIQGKVQIKDIKGDIRKTDIWETVLADEDIDIVFYLAAQTSIYVADQDPLEDLSINVMPFLRLLEYCKNKSKCPVIIFAGTVTETGLPDKLPINETRKNEPITIYDIHKLTAENYLRHYARQGLVKGAILRLANVYGPGQKSHSADRGILNMMIKKSLSGETLSIYGTGKFLRDYVFIDDVADAFIGAALNIEKINGEYFVIGSGYGYNLCDAIEMAVEQVTAKTGRKAKIINVEPPEKMPLIERRNFIADSSRFIKLTGWRPKVTLKEGIDLTIEFFLKQEKA